MYVDGYFEFVVTWSNVAKPSVSVPVIFNLYRLYLIASIDQHQELDKIVKEQIFRETLNHVV